MKHVFPGFGYMVRPPTEIGVEVGPGKTALDIADDGGRAIPEEAYKSLGRMTALIATLRTCVLGQASGESHP